MALSAVILNDTRGDNHFGCFRVMRRIEENLESRGIAITALSPVRNDWEGDASFLKAMAACDIIVINGEGTLHHGAPHGERLLKVVDHPARAAKPVVLINALYQENPDSWSRYLEKMSLIYARDSWSAETIRSKVQCEVGFVPDLSLSEGFVAPEGTSPRDKLLIGDSVSRDVRRQLLALAASTPDACLLPIRTTLKSSNPNLPLPLRLLREWYVRGHTAAYALRHGNVLLNETEAGFIRSLQQGYLHVTGRFHSVCFCLFTRTPFLAVESNSWKIEALLNDFGLGTTRLVTPDELRRRLAETHRAPFSDDEADKITAGLTFCREETGRLFDRIHEIALEGEPRQDSSVTN